MAKRLESDFVCFATGMETLASVDPSVLEFFVKVAAQAIAKTSWVESWRQDPYFQGIYVASAEGTACRILDDWEREGFLRQLDRALVEHHGRPRVEFDIPESDEPKGRPPGPPPSTSVIRLLYRCTPLPEGVHPINRGIGRDHLWIDAGEAREIAATDRLPERVAARIVRFHLIDHVRGLGDAWAADEVKRSEFSLEPLHEHDGARTWLLRGSFACEKDHAGDANHSGKLGVEGELRGVLTIRGDRIVRFRARADAAAWGANSNTWGQPPGRFPLVIAMTEVDDELSKTLQPVWRAYGAEY